MNRYAIVLSLGLLLGVLGSSPLLAAVERELRFAGGSEGVTLAGTLTLPDGTSADKPAAGIVLVTGSGPQDRDESIFDKKPFAVLARELTARGYAVLRYDDRGAGQSTGKYAEATIDDFIKDAECALRELAAQAEVDAKRLFVLGHSEGSGVAAELARAGKVSAGVIYLAGTALPGHAILTDQSVRLARASGVTEEKLEAIRTAHQTLMQTLLNDGTTREIIDKTAALIAAQSGESADNPRVKILAGQTSQQLRTPWMKRFLSHDPSEAASRATVPALALFGTLDLQVAPDANAEPMERALKASGQTLSEVRVLEGKNHLFQNARTGLIQEYAMLTEDLDPAVAQLIADWMDQVISSSEADAAG